MALAGGAAGETLGQWQRCLATLDQFAAKPAHYQNMLRDAGLTDDAIATYRRDYAAFRGERYRARRIAGVDRAEAVHSAEIELTAGAGDAVAALDPAPVAPAPAVTVEPVEQRQAVTSEPALPAEQLPESAARPESVIDQGHDQAATAAPAQPPALTEREWLAGMAPLDLSNGRELLPQMRRELQERGECEDGWRHARAEHDRRIEQIAAAAKVSGYQAELEAEPDYRAWQQARQQAAQRGQGRPRATGQAESDHIAGLPELDRQNHPELLPQLRRECRARGEADSAGWRGAMAEHDHRIGLLASAARVSGHEAELNADLDYRAWKQATQQAAQRGRGGGRGF